MELFDVFFEWKSYILEDTREVCVWVSKAWDKRTHSESHFSNASEMVQSHRACVCWSDEAAVWKVNEEAAPERGADEGMEGKWRRDTDDAEVMISKLF